MNISKRNLAEESVSSKDGEVLSILLREHLQNESILDSGISFYMTPCRDLFYTYQSCDESIVYMVENNTCKIVGLGDIKVIMFDGITCVFFGVKHVPGLQKSLL